MLATALVGVALVSPAHPLQLSCEPDALQASRHGRVLADAPGWRAFDRRGHLVAWWVSDSLTVRSARTVRVRWWCDG
jgi:hypothetical protein